jgi:D-alanine--poly(phosphoribitol) ligase subunit 1
VKVRGHRVELGEVEAYLAEICGSDSVAAVAWPVDHGSARGIVAFHCVQGLAAEDVREALMRRIPRYAVPQQVLRLTSLPLTSNGKIDRNLLVEMLEREAVAAG